MSLSRRTFAHLLGATASVAAFPQVLAKPNGEEMQRFLDRVPSHWGLTPTKVVR